jgi:two-component system sensor histidine kinase ChiS
VSELLWALAGLTLGLVVGWGCAQRRRLRNAKMLSFVAHEINTPLTSLQMTVMNLQHGTFGPVPEEHKPWLELLQGELVRLSRLVGDIRDFVKLEFHRDIRLELKGVTLPAVIEEALGAQRDAYKRAKIDLKVQIAAGLPLVHADHERMVRCVSAALSHARKFRTTSFVQVEAQATPQGAIWKVFYQGDPEHAQQMKGALQMYHPVEASNTDVLSGVGVGLGLHRELTQLQGAEMAVALRGDGGVEIHVKLVAEKA